MIFIFIFINSQKLNLIFREFIISTITESIQDNGSIIQCTDTGNLNGQTEKNILDFT